MTFEQEVREKLDKIMSMQAEHTTSLAVYNFQLKEHMKRSDLLEIGQQNLDKRLLPIENHIEFIDRLSKGILTLAAVASALAGLYHYLVSK